MKSEAIIVDLDGTLCNAEHRMHFIKEQSPPDWKSFNEGCAEDQVNSWCQTLVRQMTPVADILFVTGRSMDYYDVTMDWLGFNNIPTHGLYMRPQGDFRKDWVVKSELYKKYIEPDYDVLFVVEDRKQVVDMWRELGLTCLQCADGEF